jgi:hypothetical protein
MAPLVFANMRSSTGIGASSKRSNERLLFLSHGIQVNAGDADLNVL